MSFFQVPVFGSWPLDHSVQFIHPVFVRCDHSRNVCWRLTCATARAVAPHAAFAACVLHAPVWHMPCSKVWSKCFFDRVAAFFQNAPWSVAASGFEQELNRLETARSSAMACWGVCSPSVAQWPAAGAGWDGRGVAENNQPLPSGPGRGMQLSGPSCPYCAAMDGPE